MHTESETASCARISAGVVRLMQGFSVEATFPSRADVEAAREIVAPGTMVYLSLPSGRAPSALVDIARSVRAAGLEPVPHVVAHAFRSRNEVQEVLARLGGEAGVTRALVIGGDAEPAGPFADALGLIETGLFERNGFAELGIATYPDGHPKIPDGELAAALVRKVDAIYVRGLSAHVVTQFCFDAERIIAWLRQLRYLRLELPVRLGIAGPASVPALLRFAVKCGVRTSIKGIWNTGAAHLLGHAQPDSLLGRLGQITALSAGSVSVHVFSFGGLVATARWAEAAAAGRLDLGRLEGGRPGRLHDHSGRPGPI